ncbi:MAG: InlB B-repeat-containing protein [Clostridia bacterium]|nr:InlB B-repeat-containing protein [Clostridia bacterium]
MTNTQLHSVKRVITFIMALLTILSSFVYFDLSGNAAHNVFMYIYMGDATTVNLNTVYFSEQTGNGLPNWYGIVCGTSTNPTTPGNLFAPTAYSNLFSNPAFSRTGYDFSGSYYYSNNGVDGWIGPFGSEVAIETTANRVWYLNPCWIPKTYTLTLDANGGKINGSNTKAYSIKYNQSYKEAFNNSFPTPVRDGYEFQYYDYNKIFGLHTGSWENNYYTLTGDATMTAVWKCLHTSTTVTSTVAATCTQEGSKTQKCNNCGETFTTAIPKIDHTRQWVTSDGENRYDLYRCTVCRSFNKKRINVTFNANGGKLVVNGTAIDQPTKVDTYELKTTNENASVPVEPNFSATKPGAKFLGWSIDPYAEEADTTFSSAVNYTLHAIYGKETYTITFEPGQDDTVDPPRAATMPEGVDTVVEIHYDDLLSDAVSPTIPVPTLPGYTFTGWRVYNNGVKGGIYTSSTWASSRYRPDPVGSTVFKAEYTPKTQRTLTFNLKGGTMPSGYNTTYTFLDGQYFNDVIGGFPAPTREGYAFGGWQWNNRTDHHWTEGWGENQTYYFGQNITLDAVWIDTPYKIIFNLNDDAVNPATMESGYSLEYGIALNNSIATIVGGFPEPTRTNYTFKGWGMMVKDESGNFVNKLFTPEEGWGDAVHEYEGDVQIVAMWRWWCDHKDDNGNYHTLSWEDGEQRDYGTCPECNRIGAYGYRVKLWNKSGDICLSENLPMEDLFKLSETSDNLIFDKATSRVIDYIDDDNDPRICIDFNPCLVAAKNTEAAWVGWTYYDSRGKQQYVTHDNKYGWQYIFDDDYEDPGEGVEGSGPLRNTHLELYAIYTEGYYEVVFDGGVNRDNNGEAPHGDGVIVDSNRRYGVMAIMAGQTYKDCLYYIPTAKHTVNGVLHVSVGWKHSGKAHIENNDHLIDCATWNEGQLYQHASDSIIYAHYEYYDEDNDRYEYSVGYLSTYYANNKYAHMNGGAYNNAYFDPNEKSGGTMYYIYYRPTENGVYKPYSAGMDYVEYNGTKYPVVCEPLFAYDPDEDYIDAYKFTPSSHEQYICDFNINVYKEEFVEKGVVIAKEPKRYTIYIGEGAHFTFPTVVCDPEGNTSSDELITANKQTVNGNTFYTSAGDKRFVSTKTEFKEVVYPIMFIYTEITTLGSYNLLDSVHYPSWEAFKMGLIPYQYDGGTAATLHNYHDILPYGGKGVYFHAPYSEVGQQRYKAYTDYNSNSYTTGYQVYGSGLKLTYPNGFGTLNPAFTEQYAYYQQWDYTVAYKANYPVGQTPDNEGYTGGDTVYSLVSPYGEYVTYNSNLFTTDNYVITSWNTKADGTGTSYSVNFTMSPTTAACLFMEPGITLYAQWTKVVNFTLVEGGKGASSFATVTYTAPGVSEPVTDSNITETKTFKCIYGTQVSISNVAAASGYEFAYFTWNNNHKSGTSDVNLRLKSDRILTNRSTYTFTIVSHCAMTAQFVSEGSKNGFYIDRNNKLLRSSDDPWQLYPASSSRTKTGVAGDTVIDSALYYEYKSDTSYSITVSGSTYTAMNKTHSALYDEVLTLMTDAKNFVGWQIGGRFVSYEPVYKHRVSCDANITAVYSGTAAAGVVLLSNSNDTVIIQRNAPDGYTLVESGFLLTTASTQVTFDQLCDTSATYRLTTTDFSINGTFKLRLKAGAYYGYGYAIYKDASGNLVTATTDWLTI